MFTYDVIYLGGVRGDKHEEPYNYVKNRGGLFTKYVMLEGKRGKTSVSNHYKGENEPFESALRNQ